MGGPWEDFQRPSTASEGPWSDFQTKGAVSAPDTAPNRPPWEDFAPASGPGVLGTAKELGRSFVEGAIESGVATPLRGYGAESPEFAQQQLERLGSYQQPLSPDATPEERAAYRQRRAVINPSDEVIAERQAPFRERALQLPQETPLYRAGEAVSGAAKSVLGAPDTRVPTLARDVASGFGSVASNVATALIPGVGLPLMATSVFGQGSGEAAERAVKAKATPNQIVEATKLGSLPGATEFADALLPSLGSTGRALGLIGKVGLRALEGVLVEGGQEGLQQYIQNLIARGVYKPSQDVWEDVPYNAFVGAIVGGATSAAIGGHRGEEAPPPAQEPSAEVRESLAALRGTPLPPALQVPPEPIPAPAVVMPAAPTPVPVSPEQLTLPLGTQAANPTPPNDLPTQMPPQVSSFIEAGIERLSVPPPEELTPAIRLARDNFVKNPDDFDAKAVRAEIGTSGLIDYLQEWSRLKEEQAARALDPAQQDIRAQAGADLARLAKLLGPKLYGEPSDMSTVSVKEMVQNAFDAIKDAMANLGQTDGNIDIRMNPDGRHISIVDDGVGMTPETLGTKFLQIAGTGKESDAASGGLGIAKMLFLFGNQALSVKTMRNGKVAKLVTTGEQLFSALNDPERNPRIEISEPSVEDRRMFPKGHGTVVIVKVPETYKDTTTGETKSILFMPYKEYHEVLKWSPLFRDISVTFNGLPVPGVGRDFATDAFSQFANVNFDWGTARIYVSKQGTGRSNQLKNLHVLSNGLWQFSQDLQEDPNSWGGPNIDRTFYVDVNPKVKPEDPGYPFDLNRQNFSSTAKNDFDKIFNYMNLVYTKEKFTNDVKNWGDNYYLSVEPDGRVFASDKIKIEPKVPITETPLGAIRAGDSVTVKDGKLIVQGRVIPELTPADLAKTKINFDELRIDQGDIDPNRVMVHDNVNVTLSGATIELDQVPFDPKLPNQPPMVVTADGGYEVRSMVELGRERFGARFDRFLHDIGQSFIQLRDVVAEAMNYPDMRSEAVGISFDIQYRGVSIRVPFAGFFVNPAATEYRDTLRASIGIVGTMVHELAHHQVRSHNADFPAEMQRILIALDVHPTWNFHAFKQQVVNVWAANEDIATYLYGVLDGSVGPVSPRGKQFSDARQQQVGDGSLASSVAAALSGSGRPGGPTRGTTPSTTAPGAQQGPADVSVSSPATDIADWFVSQYLGIASAPGRNPEPGGAVHFEEIAAASGKSPAELQQLVEQAVAGGGKDFSLARQTREGYQHLRLRIAGREYTGIKLKGSGNPLAPQFQERVPNVSASISRGSGGEADNGLGRNQRALDATDEGDAGAVPIQPETRPIRDNLSSLFQNVTPPPVKAAAAHADRMNRFYKWMAGLDQLAQLNPFFTPLLRYLEGVRDMHLEESKLHDAALRVSKEWRSLGEEGDRVVGFLDDLTNMVYRAPNEVSNGIARHPSQQELDRLVAKHQLSAEGVKLVTKIKTLTDGFLQLVGLNAIERAKRTIQDPQRLQAKIRQVQRDIQALAARPYFPFMRFGRHYVAVKDPAGKIIHFETVEGQGFDRLAGKNKAAERAQQRRVRELSSVFQKDYGRTPTPQEVYYGVLPESVGPLVGMPQLLLDQMKDTMFLSPAQMQNLNVVSQASAIGLTPTLNPRYQKRYFRAGQSVYTPGYSMDFRRSFARYFFHGAKFYSKTKYLDGLRDLVGQAETIPGNKEGYIASYMRDHLDNTVLDAKGDFGIFKAGVFLWAMGYVPAAATQNLSQTPMITLPFLAAKFGDVRAAREITAAMTKLSSFYKRGSYDNQTDFEMKALGYGIKTGRISETQAPELAGIAQGTNLLKGIGGNRAEQSWVWFMEKAAWMFEHAEQWNRRIAYRAALNLALKDPKAKFVDEAIRFNETEFQRLQTEEGFSEAQARAITVANHAVEQTQFTYARWARPRFMRGRLPSTLFVFKKYIQSLYMMLGNNKRDVLPRYLIISAFVGGLGGLPFAEDFLSLMRAVWSWLGFGTNLEHEARKYILQFSNGQVEPDIVLHGLSRRGLGLPALLDMLGSFATGRPGRGLAAPRHQAGRPVGFAQNVPFPVLDRSRALGPGMIAPLDIGKLFTPTQDLDRTIAEQTQKASGAVFSVGFNIYKAIMDNNLPASDWKRWERAVPRQLGDISRSWRTFSEGRERSKGGPAGGSTIVPFDARDTEQMMEILAMLGGYQPLRVQARWDSIMAQAEVEKFYDLQRNGLLGQLFEARSAKRREEIDAVVQSIKEFNAGLPEWARGKSITSETALKSLQTRERARVSREAGVPTQRSNVPIAREIDRLFPEATVDVRRVR